MSQQRQMMVYDVEPLVAPDRRVVQAVARLEYVAGGVAPTEEMVEDGAARLSDELVRFAPASMGVFVASWRMCVAGVGRICRHADVGSQWWLGLLVHPNHRRRGIATALFAACRKHAVEHGASVIWSEFRVDNAAAVALHERLGFGCDGRLRCLSDGSETVVFSLTLEDADAGHGCSTIGKKKTHDS
jgi:GNAT superfamily N-acetyltransferase